MSTVFIAVRCFQCSTMQVKQQKKSSNKWTCVVCNEKQSLQRVFAKGYAAKDVRKFVQSFNMARKSVDEQGTDMEENMLVVDDDIPRPSTDGGLTLGSDQDKKKRRVDWSEYIDEERIPGDELRFNRVTGEENHEPNIITEWPDEVSKRPKSKHPVDCEEALSYESRFSIKQRAFSDFEDTSKNRHHHHQPRLIGGGSKHVEGRDSLLKKKFREDPTKSILKVSKWSRFIDEEDEEEYEGCYTRQKNQVSSEMNDDESTMDQIVVEDDVHPEFA